MFEYVKAPIGAKVAILQFSNKYTTRFPNNRLLVPINTTIYESPIVIGKNSIEAALKEVVTKLSDSIVNMKNRVSNKAFETSDLIKAYFFIADEPNITLYEDRVRIKASIGMCAFSAYDIEESPTITFSENIKYDTQ